MMLAAAILERGIVIGVLWFLVFLCILVGIGWVIIWVLGQLGIPIPPMVVKIVLLVVGLLCLIYFISLLAGGAMNFPRLGHLGMAVPFLSRYA